MKFNNRFLIPFFALISLLFSGLACQAAGATPTPGFDALETMVAQTLQAGPGQPSPLPTFAMPTAIPTSTPWVVNTPASLATSTTAPVSLPNGTRIQFLTGTTQNITTGTIPSGQVITYIIRAMQGQAMMASVGTPSQQTRLAIFGANGTVLLPANQGSSSWQGTLPSTQDYYFQVIGGSTTENFTLDVTIAARVQFASGEIKTTLKGETVNGYPVTYVAYAKSGQKMDVTLTVSGDSAAITIWGLSDGVPYARAQNGIQDFSFDLTSTQDYIIQVVPQAGQEVNYSLLVRIK
jgi:hypothetical protein